jgi:hypothetical protein
MRSRASGARPGRDRSAQPDAPRRIWLLQIYPPHPPGHAPAPRVHRGKGGCDRWMGGLRGRHHPQPDRSLQLISSESAQEFFADAQTLLGRDATKLARRGDITREVLRAADGVDVLVCARDGVPVNPGPAALDPPPVGSPITFGLGNNQPGLLFVLLGLGFVVVVSSRVRIPSTASEAPQPQP